MKIIFMGTPQFAVSSLDNLLAEGYDIPAVVTTQDKPKGRGLQLLPSEIKKFALGRNLKVIQPVNLKDIDFISEIRSLNPDLIVVVAFRILPKEVYEIPHYGSINLHASLLPKYRGAAPVNWAIIKGEKETGVTTFFLKEKVDTGNIILQKKIPITVDDNFSSLHDKLSVLGADALIETLKMIESGKAAGLEQDDLLAYPAPKIFKEDCRINWNDNSINIHNLIRGLSEYPAAYTSLNNKSIKIYYSKLTDIPTNKVPGEIIIKDRKFFVCTQDFLLEILELQPEGKKRMKAKDFINGLASVKNLRFD